MTLLAFTIHAAIIGGAFMLGALVALLRGEII